MRKLIYAAALAVAAGSASSAGAQTYPSRPITLVVPLARRRLDRRDRAHHGRGHARRRSASPSSSRTSPAPAAPSVSAASRARRPTATPFGIGQWGTNVASGAIYPLPVRSAEGFRADRADRDPAVPDRRPQDHAGERSQGADRLAEGQRGQGLAGQLRHRHAEPRRRHALPERHRRPLPDGAVSQRRPVDAGSGGRPDRRDARHAGGLAAAGALAATSRPTRSPPRAAWRSRRKFRPPTKPACPASISRSGTRSGRPKARRRRSSPSSTTRS